MAEKFRPKTAWAGKPLPGKSPPKFGFSRLLEEVARLQRQASAPEAMDRRAVLARLCGTLGAEEGVLLRRGFDRAYRRIVEGV